MNSDPSAASVVNNLSDTDNEIPSGHSEAAPTSPNVLIYGLVTLATGVGAGLGGMALALLLHLIQHLAYGYSLGALVGKESFLQGVLAAPPWRRVLALLGCGVLGGCGWLLVYRFGHKLLSVAKAVEPGAPPMPPVSTLSHVLLQISTVALGSPLGREVAPREVGALLAGAAARSACLPDEDIRIMIACGAGAGLAAVYNVPLAGALYTLEVLLRTARVAAVIPAIATSFIATVVAWIGLGDEVQYHFPDYPISATLVVWALLAGPVLGLAAGRYVKVAAWARKHAPRDARLVPRCLAVLAAIGIAAVWFPELLGNGKAPNQLDFSGDIPFRLALELLVLKFAAVIFTLRAGAEGGLMTPGIAIGGFIAVILGSLWNWAGAGVPLGAYAIVGGTGFLAVSMAMPLTAIVLMFEFTHAGQDFFIPIMAATAGSLLANLAVTRRSPVNR